MKLLFEDKINEEHSLKDTIHNIESKYERDIEFLRTLGINLSIEPFTPYAPYGYEEPTTVLCFKLASTGDFKIECGELMDIADTLNSMAEECDTIIQ